jgi:hypothetical protein
MNDPFIDTRNLLAACVVDFALHLASRPNPLIIGRDYAPDKLAEEFKIWAASRRFNTSERDGAAWENLWQSGLLQ